MKHDDSYIQKICLITITSILVGVVLKELSVVLIPLVLAIMCSYILAPIVDWSVQRFSIPKSLGILFSLGLTLILLLVLGLLISSSVGVLTENTAEYEAHIHMLNKKALDWLNLGPILWLNNQGVEINLESFSQLLSKVPVSGVLGGLTNTLLQFLSNSFLILIFVIYLLEGRNPQEKSSPLIEKIENKIEKYLLIKMVLSIITGASVTFFLWMLNVDLAMVFGLLAFVLNFIPNVGSIIATLLPIPMILVNPEASVFTIILAIGLPGTIQMVVGNVVEPKLLGDSLELHPITVLLSLIFWGIIWGIAGMLLAAPITAVLKILLENIEITKPFAKLLEGKFPKTIEESIHSDTSGTDKHKKTQITDESVSAPGS
jgi:AI-2 transport protein TqsA